MSSNNKMIKAPGIILYDRHKPCIWYDDIISEYEENGTWTDSILLPVDLRYLALHNWNPGRYKDNLNLMSKTRKCPAIDLDNDKDVNLNSYDPTKDKINIINGNHRSTVAKELGYTHTYAWTSIEKKYKPQESDELINFDDEFYNDKPLIKLGLLMSVRYIISKQK